MLTLTEQQTANIDANAADKAVEMLATNPLNCQRFNERQWRVFSASEPGKLYTVTMPDGFDNETEARDFTCTCPSTWGNCWHRQAAYMYLQDWFVTAQGEIYLDNLLDVARHETAQKCVKCLNLVENWQDAFCITCQLDSAKDYADLFSDF